MVLIWNAWLSSSLTSEGGEVSVLAKQFRSGANAGFAAEEIVASKVSVCFLSVSLFPTSR